MAIHIDAEMMHDKAKELRDLRAAHDENIRRIHTLMESMGEVFQGQAATAYANRYAEMQPVITSFSEMIEEFAVELDSVATNFTETDTGLASSLS